MNGPPNPSKAKRCPMCGKPRCAEFAPFCSARCRDRDLARWLNEGYAVPGPAAGPDDGADDDR